tara:strand:+ start:55 stop:270 length:216 start_codon:yes stop_codon:yes gene_type:complete
MNNDKQQTEGNKMKKIAMVIGVLTVLATSANAFTWSSPNIYGGYNYYSNGSMGWSSPNIYGGYNYYGSLFN